MIDKTKAKYHEKFRKNIKHDKPYFEQLLERAWSERDKHPALNPYTKDDKKILQYREELKALNELIKLYQLQIDIKAEKSQRCNAGLIQERNKFTNSFTVIVYLVPN